MRADGTACFHGSDNPFRDAELADADIELMKADLAAGTIAILRVGPRSYLALTEASQHQPH